jgi:hypothetical protein
VITLYKCSTCKEDKPSSGYCFDAKNAKRDFLHGTCKDCRSAQQRLRRKTVEGQRAHRSTHLKFTYGITIEDKERMYDEQGGLCKCCSRSFPLDELEVEHNHTTKKVRGLCCHPCNIVTGYVEKHGIGVLNAAEYLRACGDLK